MHKFHSEVSLIFTIIVILETMNNISENLALYESMR